MSETKQLAEFEKILALAQNNPSWGNDERKLLREFREKLGSPAIVAERLGVSIPTIYSWEKQTSKIAKKNDRQPPPPTKKLLKFRELILSREDKVTEEDVKILGKIRSAGHLFECGKYCKRFWTLRAGKPFVSLTDEKMLDSVVNFLKLPEGPFSYLVFPKYQFFPVSGDNQKLSDSKISCVGLMSKLKDRLPNSPGISHLDKMIPVEIEDESKAWELGLTDRWIAYAMAEYSEEGYARYGKSIDVWVEFSFDCSDQPQAERKEYTRWLELPTEQAELWRDRRQSFFNKVVKEKAVEEKAVEATDVKALKRKKIGG